MENKDKLPPIPTPASQRWREFRIQVLPIVVFIGALAAIVYLWKNYVQPIGVIGAAETNQVNVTSLQDGLIQSLFVERFQTVTQGQQIAVVANTDIDLLKAQIDSVQADIEVMRERTKVDIARTEQNYQEFRQQLLSLRVTQASDRASWFALSNEAWRAEQEVKAQVSPQAVYDIAKAKFDALSAAIEGHGKQIEDMEKTLTFLRKELKPGVTDPFTDAVEKKAHELDLMLKPSTLKAPIDGMVSVIYHQANERIVRGTPIVAISDPETRRIIGYIRQPVTAIPTTNDYALITTRTLTRQAVRGQILHVGAQMEPISPALLSPDTKRMEVGLPILVSVPAGVRLVPGEFVTLSIEYSRK